MTTKFTSKGYAVDPPFLLKSCKVFEMEMKWIRKVYQDDSGASAMEYAIIMGFIAIVIIGAVTIFGSVVKGLFDKAYELFPK